MRYSSNRLSLLICINAIIFLSSCNHIPQKYTAVIPANRSTASISVPLFTNESHQYGLEEIFTNLLIKEIVYDSRLQIVNNQPSDLMVKGKILSYETTPVSYTEQNIDKYRLFMQIEIIILNCSNARDTATETIWKGVIGDSIDFISSSSTLVAKGFVAKEEDAVAYELCQRICSQLVAKIISTRP